MDLTNTSFACMSVSDSDAGGAGEHLYRALLACDARFDGLFFIGVTSTGVYCRPVCPAPKPRADRCRYFASAAAAERRGFRPCLRCRPELAPGRPLAHATPGAVATVDTVRRLAGLAQARIATGALDEGGVEQLATGLGVSARHLRRALQRDLGVSPIQLAQTQRLLLATQLLRETTLPVTRIAFASGFRTPRRFNAAFRSRYGVAPTNVRRGAARTTGDLSDSISVSLAFRPPYHWPAIREYLTARAVPGVEAITEDGAYCRTVNMGDCRGVVVVDPVPQPNQEDGTHRALRVQVSMTLLPVLAPLLARIRRLFDLDADPMAVDGHLAQHAMLAPLVARRPGLRVAGAFDGFELAVRAIVGQQISVRGATTIAGRLVRAIGEPVDQSSALLGQALSHYALTAERVAAASLRLLTNAGLTRSRADTILRLARAVAGGQLPDLTSHGLADHPAVAMRRLMRVPRIGAWTASYIALRAYHWPDAFPEGDLGLRRAAGGLTPARLRELSQAWRPWRAYAAQHLWASRADSTATSILRR